MQIVWATLLAVIAIVAKTNYSAIIVKLGESRENWNAFYSNAQNLQSEHQY